MLPAILFGVGLFCGALGYLLTLRYLHHRNSVKAGPPGVAELIRQHLAPATVEQISVCERRFPFRVRADLQRALDRLFGEEIRILHFTGIRREYSHEGLKLSDCLIDNAHNPAVAVPPEFEELDVGDEAPIRVLKQGLWLVESLGVRFLVLLSPYSSYGPPAGLQIQIGAPPAPEHPNLVQDFFRQLELAIRQAQSYRGKILSLEQSEFSYGGHSTGITVHKLRTVGRDDVILPPATLTLLERNVIQFVQRRQQLAQLQQSTRKGLLFYGPPGTGKTHTIHYLAQSLPEHTTLLISAEQVGLLGEYMLLARLLQPSIVVMEDVDLIARSREQMNSPCEEALLNKLLNEMDGLKEDADILFLLTTNRPDTLEAALASRPGRIDQAIEFPLPDETGRQKLIALYARNTPLTADLQAEIVRRTEGVSAAFIKELMRRIAQYYIERGGSGDIERDDVDSALHEMLHSSGALNLKLLGAGAVNH